MNDRIIIVLAEPLPDLTNQLQQAFQYMNYRLIRTSSGREALQVCEQYNPFLFITDMTLPDMEGIEVIRRMQEQSIASQSHKIVLSNRPEEYLEVVAFQYGADDYLRKPIRIRAYIKRLEALIRREQNKRVKRSLKISSTFHIDPNQYLIHQQGETFFLPKKEFNLLYLLASNPSRIFSRSELITQVWEQDVLVLPRTVDVHIRKIRQKIGSQFIETVTGKGYQFVPQTTVQFAP